MALEIERKYKVNVEKFYEYLSTTKCKPSSQDISQFYILDWRGYTLRFREARKHPESTTEDTVYSITYKGPSRAGGLVRTEIEIYPAAVLGRVLKSICEACKFKSIVKTRTVVMDTYSKVHFPIEVDQFYGDNVGLWLAEIEQPNMDQPAWTKEQLPEWLGDEVTGQPQYYNSMLAN